jgi:hypothetical protein
LKEVILANEDILIGEQKIFSSIVEGKFTVITIMSGNGYVGVLICEEIANDSDN